MNFTRCIIESLYYDNSFRLQRSIQVLLSACYTCLVMLHLLDLTLTLLSKLDCVHRFIFTHRT